MGHCHEHHHAPESYNWSFAVATLLNLLFVIAEFVYALMANSMSLLADAGHNLGDVMGLALAWGANWLMTKASSERYSYGYKRTSILAALINAMLLIATTALIARESIEKLLYPETVNETVVIVVALIGIVINGGTALLFIRGNHNDLNIRSAFLHLASDALISLGVAVGGAVMMWTNWHILDPMIGLLIVVTILYASWGLLRDSLHLIMDAVPKKIDRQAVQDYLLSLPGVDNVHDLHIWGLSTRENALTAHLIMPEADVSDALYKDINKTMHDRFNIDHVTIQVERGDIDDNCQRIDTC